MPTRDDMAACGLVVRPHEHALVVDGHEVDLTAREFEIVTKLVEHPGWVFTPEQLASDEGDIGYSPESVSVLVSRLRRKLAQAGARDCIETVRGSGYRIHASGMALGAAVLPDVDGRDALHEASWRLLEAVLDIAHSGSDEQRQAAIRALDSARSIIRSTSFE